MLLEMLVTPDDDNDARPDTADKCPKGVINWMSTDTNLDGDSDGCRDSDEDVDDDNNRLIEIGNNVLAGVDGLLMLHNIR